MTITKTGRSSVSLSCNPMARQAGFHRFALAVRKVADDLTNARTHADDSFARADLIAGKKIASSNFQRLEGHAASLWAVLLR